MNPLPGDLAPSVAKQSTKASRLRCTSSSTPGSVGVEMSPKVADVAALVTALMQAQESGDVDAERLVMAGLDLDEALSALACAVSLSREIARWSPGGLEPWVQALRTMEARG